MHDGQTIQLRVGSREVSLTAPQSAPSAAGQSERIFFWWGLTASALALAKELEGRRLDGLRVLELGCGLGLPGVVAALGAAQVCFTDYHAAALTYARKNAEANGLTGEVEFRVLDWERPDVTQRFDLVLGAEILYDYNLHGALLALLPRLVAADGIVLLADRRRLVVDRFLGRLRDLGHAGGRTDHTLAVPGESEQTVTVFDWSPAPAA